MACPLLAGMTGMCAGARSSAGAAAGGERSGACKGTGKLARCGSGEGPRQRKLWTEQEVLGRAERESLLKGNFVFPVFLSKKPTKILF